MYESGGLEVITLDLQLNTKDLLLLSGIKSQMLEMRAMRVMPFPF